MEFVPLWTDILEGPCWKIMDLPAEQYRFWTFCLLAAQKYDFADGHLPDERTLAHWCQMDRDTCVTLRDGLVTCGLVDRDMGCDPPEYRLHDWDQWRAVKDSGAKDRKRRQRARNKGLANESRNGHGQVTVESQDVTPQITSSSIQHSSSSTPPTPSKGESVCAGEDLEPFQSPTETPQSAWTSEQRRVLEKATKWWGASNGDSIVGGLLETYPVAMVDEAIDSHHGKVNQSLHPGRLTGLCRTIWDEGRWRPKLRIASAAQTNQPPVIPMNHPPMPGHMSRAEYEAQRARAK